MPFQVVSRELMVVSIGWELGNEDVVILKLSAGLPRGDPEMATRATCCLHVLLSPCDLLSCLLVLLKP